MKIVVIGGTGLIGSKLVEKLRRGFFQTTSRNILAVETATGLSHHVVLSVVCTDPVAGQRLPSNPHQLTQETTAEATVEIWTGRAEKPAQHEQERLKRFLGIYLRSRPIRAAALGVRHFHHLERAEENEWTHLDRQSRPDPVPRGQRTAHERNRRSSVPGDACRHRYAP
jgi:hypothetical protein